MNRRLLARLAAGTVAPVVLLASSPAWSITSSGYESQVVNRTNVKRVERDLVKLKTFSCVDRYAERQARRMAASQELRHQALRPILEACDLTGVAENIATGHTSGNRAVSAWMRSPGHRRNLLNPKMRYIGVGAVKDDDGRWWVAQVFGTRK